MSKFKLSRRCFISVWEASLIIGIALASQAFAQNIPQDPPAGRPKLDVAAIYFPSWHSDDHYSSWYGEDWNEWRLLRDNPQRFPGHNRIKPTDAWGCFDEADPQWMARQIDLAADHGINVFVFDWYWYKCTWPPQKNHYPYTPTVIDNTPQKFGDLFRRALKHCDESKLRPPALFVNSWNEWTEGSALLPQQKYGDGYLKEMKKSLDEHASPPQAINRQK